MFTVTDDLLRKEANRFTLRFTCEHCQHFDSEGARCSLGYPTEGHLAVDLDRAKSLVFCKGFELG